MINHLLLFLIFIGATTLATAQSTPQEYEDTITTKQLSPQYIDRVSSKIGQVQQKLDKKTEKTLHRMQKEELKLRSRLARIDSNAAKKLFADSEKKYRELLDKLAKDASKPNPEDLASYLPYLDTLKTSLRFLGTDGQKLLVNSEDIQLKLKDVISKVNNLDARMNQAQAIRQFLKERRQYLKEQLSKFGLGKHLKKMNKEVYYYSQAIAEYKEVLKDPKKIEAKALAVLRNVPAFKKFMQRHSQLSSIFGIPSQNPGPVSFAGLQSRATVQQAIQALPVGSNPQQFISQQMQSANSQLASQKNSVRLSAITEHSGETPDFKPNDQKGKSFFKRLEFGTNVQFGKVNRFLPSVGEFALSVGYKLNNSGIIGIGSSYKLGLGTGLNAIKFSHQGFGMRSYIDWKIKGSLYISGGYERNNLPQLRNTIAPVPLSTWQESGLIGISKKYSIKKRKGFVQLLFDFLSYKNIPQSQPVLFRTGVNF